MSNKQLRTIIRVVHLVTAVLILALVYSDSLRTTEAFVTLMRVVVIPMVSLSGIAMWQQASLSRLRRRLVAKADHSSVQVG